MISNEKLSKKFLCLWWNIPEEEWDNYTFFDTIEALIHKTATVDIYAARIGRGVKIEKNAIIGKYARIGDWTRIGEGVKIGDYRMPLMCKGKYILSEAGQGKIQTGCEILTFDEIYNRPEKEWRKAPYTPNQWQAVIDFAKLVEQWQKKYPLDKPIK